MSSRNVIWAIFAALVVAAAVFYHFSDSENLDDGGGQCAWMGFMGLTALIVGTILEAIGERRKRGADGEDSSLNKLLPPDDEGRTRRL